MINQIILIAVLLITAGAANGLMDTLAFHFKEGNYLYRFKSKWFGNPADTWVNKYKNYPEDKRPAYWGAKTFLSFTTDAWHFFKFFQLQGFKLSITVAFPMVITNIQWADYVIVFGVITLILSIGFHFTYTILNKFL